MRSVDYTLSEDDLVEFGMLSLRVSDVFKANLRRVVVLGLLLVVAFSGVLFLTGKDPWVALFLFVLGVPAIVFLVPPLIWRRMPAQLRRQLATSKNRTLIGQNRLELLDDGVKRVHSQGEAKVSWASVERLIAGKTFLALYIAANQAFIVPRRSFSMPEDEAAFRGEVERRANGRFVEVPW